MLAMIASSDTRTFSCIALCARRSLARTKALDDGGPVRRFLAWLIGRVAPLARIFAFWACPSKADRTPRENVGPGLTAECPERSPMTRAG